MRLFVGFRFAILRVSVVGGGADLGACISGGKKNSDFRIILIEFPIGFPKVPPISDFKTDSVSQRPF